MLLNPDSNFDSVLLNPAVANKSTAYTVITPMPTSSCMICSHTARKTRHRSPRVYLSRGKIIAVYWFAEATFISCCTFWMICCVSASTPLLSERVDCRMSRASSCRPIFISQRGDSGKKLMPIPMMKMKISCRASGVRQAMDSSGFSEAKYSIQKAIARPPMF